VALGRLTAGQLDADVGDEVTLEGAQTRTFRVVGIAVLPPLGPNTGVGVGALLTFDGATLLDPEIDPSMAAVVLRPGSSPTAADLVADAASTPPSAQGLPPHIRNVARIEGVPTLLAVLLAVLAVVVLAHTLVQSVRARRHDLAILRALGADRRGVGRTVHWQATALTIVPIVVGVPLGLLVSRLVFESFVDRIGAVSDVTTPVLLVVAVVAGLLLVANVVGAIPAARARRVAPAAALRVE
jgi:predicted lysophospholipase L1 biosynthesis ABC-type transport system permease subunit